MNKFKEIKPEELNESTFKLIGKDWMLITAENNNKVNAMTASWGGFGIMFAKNVVFIAIRPQRYTKKFVDNSNTFSLTFFDETFRKQLTYFGTVSGKNEDKISKADLTIQHADSTPYFEEGRIVIICKKIYAQDFAPECCTVNGLDEKWYPEKDYHTFYIAEIEKILIKNS
ncbi:MULTISPECIES: flavin reductase [unclassified Clostridium]|uniref:flavin reductase n=1 Tax=unclassified Clostridium TaxID=2614128 RepID=UPI000297B764|nr:MULTISPECIES: flavin reductase [unclassified Clostridium]EKQ54718.1 MAG: putative protein of DIM6/NTAB family [Clostridium sp. Maddingley MBC34-26]